MMITCTRCGSETFRAGVIELSPQGGFDVVLPCSNCGTPNPLLHENDPELAKMLFSFFAEQPTGSS